MPTLNKIYFTLQANQNLSIFHKSKVHFTGLGCRTCG